MVTFTGEKAKSKAIAFSNFTGFKFEIVKDASQAKIILGKI